MSPGLVSETQMSAKNRLLELSFCLWYDL